MNTQAGSWPSGKLLKKLRSIRHSPRGAVDGFPPKTGAEKKRRVHAAAPAPCSRPLQDAPRTHDVNAHTYVTVQGKSTHL